MQAYKQSAPNIALYAKLNHTTTDIKPKTTEWCGYFSTESQHYNVK